MVNISIVLSRILHFSFSTYNNILFFGITLVVFFGMSGFIYSNRGEKIIEEYNKKDNNKNIIRVRGYLFMLLPLVILTGLILLKKY
jgi:hypothetical protein